MKTIKYEVTYNEKASRLELFIRIIWFIPSYIIMIVLGILAYIAIILQWLHILFTGKRNKNLHGLILKYHAYMIKSTAYTLLLTEERNPIMPED